MVLSGALKDNSVIERLLLHDNPLGEVGAWHLMAAITANKNLEYIGLQGANFLSTCESRPTQAVCHISSTLQDLCECFHEGFRKSFSPDESVVLLWFRVYNRSNERLLIPTCLSTVHSWLVLVHDHAVTVQLPINGHLIGFLSMCQSCKLV